MTKSKGIGSGNYDRGEYGKNPNHFLKIYKTTERPRKCDRCTQNAYYRHPDYGYLCAPHLLDLVNIAQMAFRWADYEEVWNRCGRLLERDPKAFGTAYVTDVPKRKNAKKPKK